MFNMKKIDQKNGCEKETMRRLKLEETEQQNASSATSDHCKITKKLHGLGQKQTLNVG